MEGATELLLLLPAFHRRGVEAELRRRCGAAGFACEIRRGTATSSKKQVAVLTASGPVDEHALARLSRWTYAHLGTRPYDPAEVPEGERAPPDTTWTATELKLVIGRLVKTEFVRGVERICEAHGVRCDWRVDRSFVTLGIVIVIAGPANLVKAAAADVGHWQMRFADGTS